MKNIIFRTLLIIMIGFSIWIVSVFITPVEPESFAFKEDEISLVVGQEKSFIDQNILYPDESWMYIKCVCEDENVAKVISTDNIKAIKTGETVMKCSAGKKQLGSIRVIVK